MKWVYSLQYLFHDFLYIWQINGSCYRSNTYGTKLSLRFVNIWKDMSQFIWEVFLEFCCKAIITCRFIICFRILWFHLSFMISWKDISASQRLKYSLDIFFVLEIWLRNPGTLKNVLEPFSSSSICLMLARILTPFASLFSYW